MKASIKHIAIFASGQGSNAAKIINYFKQHDIIKVSLILTNNPQANVIELAKQYGIPFYVTNKDEFFSTHSVVPILKYHKINFIALAGFLWKVPVSLIQAFPHQIINLHPALLPKFGGKGMYGIHVHEAVINAGERESGITIHYVNEELDKGDIVFQAKCSIDSGETADNLSLKIRKLEHAHYAITIENLLL